MRANPRTVLLDQYAANKILLGSATSEASFLFCSGKLRGLAEALTACGYTGNDPPLQASAWLHDCEATIAEAKFSGRGHAHD